MPSKRSKSRSLSRKRLSPCRAHQSRRYNSPRRCVNVRKSKSRSPRASRRQRSRSYPTARIVSIRQFSVSPTRRAESGVVDEVTRSLQMGVEPMTIMQRVRAKYGENSQAINVALASLAAVASSAAGYKYNLTADKDKQINFTNIKKLLASLPESTKANVQKAYLTVKNLIKPPAPQVPTTGSATPNKPAEELARQSVMDLAGADTKMGANLNTMKE
jgi:hypothetical protein